MLKRFETKTTGILNSLDLKSRKNRIIYYGMFLIVALVSMIVLLPCVWILLSCFKEPTEFYAVPPKFLPDRIDFGKIKEVWNLLSVPKYYLNSAILSVGMIGFTIAFCALGGYVLSRLKPKGAALVFSVVFWSMMIPETVRKVPLFMTFVDFPIIHANLTNTYLPMFLMAGANSYNVLLFRSFFNGIPMSYIEAARIDGCTDFGIFRKIILPLSKPILVVVSIFVFNGSWGSFFWPYLVLKNEDILPLAVKLYELKTTVTIDKYLIMLLFSIVPPALIFSIFSKQIMGGLSMDGIKG